MGHPTWMYRRGEAGVEARLFADSDAIPADEGWHDSPNIPEASVDLDAMDKPALLAFALQQYGADLDGRMSVENLRKRIREMA